MQRCGRAERSRLAGTFPRSFPPPLRIRNHDPFPHTPKCSASFIWVHEVEITNHLLRTTLGLKGHTGSYVAQPGLVPRHSLRSARVTTETC